MPSTMKRCAGKSTKSQEHNLIYHRNFWDFYLANQSDLDRYLECAVSKYSRYMPAEDLKQEILVSLHDRDILKKYDSNKSQLNTFITNWFRWEAYHLSSTQKKHNKRQMLTSELNEMPKGQPSGFPLKILVDKVKTDDGAIVNDFISSLREMLPEYQQKILDFLVEEYSQRDIAEKFDNSPACICQHMRQIRKSALNLTERTDNVK